LKTVVVGSAGMLGCDLVEAVGAAGWEACGFDLPAIDITDPDSVEAVLPEDADVVINCAAYTRVDDAESERELAVSINGDGAGNLARVCAARGVRMLQLSTDYVFDGKGTRPYREEDPVEPINAYGASKLEGERQVMDAGGPHLVVRAQSLFGVHGPSFVRAIRRKLDEGSEPLRVVNDQVCSPTYTRHLAEAIVALIESGSTGIVHVRASGECSWWEFAGAIAEQCSPGTTVYPVPSSVYPTPAARPAYSIIDCTRYQEWTKRAMPHWREGLAAFLGEKP